ncbi:MAG: tetratricopeptide repeat protein [Planctomycetota bacterium]
MESRVEPTRTVAVLLLGTIVCFAIIVVVVTGSFWGAVRASQSRRKPLQTNGASNTSRQSDPVSPLLEPPNLPVEVKLTLEEQDRALRNEQIEVARRLLAAFPDDTNAAFLMGMAYFEQGNVVEAEEHLEKSLKLLPHRADAYDHLGRIALLKGEYKRAVTLFCKALKNDPNMPGIHFRIAKAHVFLGNPRKAISELQKDIEISPGFSESYCLLGETYSQLKEYQKAKENYEVAIQIRPDYTKAYYGLATVCARQGLKDKCREYQQKFKQFEAEDRRAGRHWRQVLDPLRVTRESVAHTHTDIGRVYHTHGYSDRAEQLWQKAATLDPNNVDCRFHLAALYLQKQRLSDALKLYEQLTQIEPESGISYFFIGKINTQRNRFDDAEKAYKKVIEVTPNRSDGYRALAQLYMQINRNSPEAKILASKAVELEQIAGNYFILAAACDKNGDLAGALSAIERAIELDPDNGQYQRVYRLIQERK